MPWTDNRKFRVRFLKDHIKGQDHIIQFEVAEAGRVEFYKTVEYFLAGCRTAGGLVKNVDTILGDNGEPVELEIQIHGFQEKLMHVMNQYGGELSKNSVSFK